MALDTATKRGAALGVGGPPNLVLPIPDGEVGEGDRAQLAGVALPGITEVSDGRIQVDVNAGIILCKDPDVALMVTFDWSSLLSDGLTLTSVTHNVPDPLTASNQDTDTDEGTSQVDISGGAHASMHTVEIRATLSSGQIVVRNWPIRVFNG